MSAAWYTVDNAADVVTPALVLHPGRIASNIEKMIGIAGDPARLRPHIKTHKSGMIVIMLLAQGITKFKCATLAEAEMLGECLAPDVMLAAQPVGPAVSRLLDLLRRYPDTNFSVMVDDERCLARLAEAAAAAGITIRVWLDLDCGMHRTGVKPGEAAVGLYRFIHSTPGLEVAGLHAYDGHIHDTDMEIRRQQCEEAFTPVNRLREQLSELGLPVPAIVAGGTPTFPVHAQPPHAECSPGTCVLWDFGYADRYPDLEFEFAALLLTRVVSKPAANRLCLDLGHKAVAAEQPSPRVRFLNLPDAREVMHSEEHLVIESDGAEWFEVGDCLYAVPRHVCPTVALHDRAFVVDEGRIIDRWKISARGRIS
ncbi:MAG TPA: threonine aldolase [Verrucomicrobiales bacterium]|nr:threonine aldolase [Verrucomicrobiales bacterium]